jgi:hypothetical protein
LIQNINLTAAYKLPHDAGMKTLTYAMAALSLTLGIVAVAYTVNALNNATQVMRSALNNGELPRTN